MFHGSIVAIVTPMQINGEIDYPALRRLMDWHLESQTDGIVILGTTGESPTIDQNERRKLIEMSVAYLHERIPLIVGTGTNCTKSTIENTKMAMELGADAALIVTPYYNKPTQEGLYQHFSAIAKAVPIPQILYNVPGRTSCDLLPETVARLSTFPNIVAVKEATGKISRLEELLALETDIDFFSGEDANGAEFILKGGKGVISVTANVAPALMHEMTAAALGGNKELALELDEKLALLHKNLFLEANPIPAKWALAQMGRIQSGIRLPLTPLSAKFHGDVKKALAMANLLEIE